MLSRLYRPDRGQRQRAARAFTAGLKASLRISSFILNNILADKASDDRLRHYPTWIAARHLDNQIDEATVEALVQAVTGRYDIVARYYRLKRRLLGLEELADYDRYAPLPAADRQLSWAEACRLVEEAYAGFHPELGRIARTFMDRRWIDAAPAPGKRGGAYSHGAVPSAHPYVFLNYEGTPRDVMTLAHELGHGAHQYLSRRQGLLLADTPLTTAETASVFGEMLTFQSLLAREREPAARLALLVSKIEDSFATVFRQTAMNRFEEAIHGARRAEGELAPDRFGELWMQTQTAMFQGSVTLTEDYRHLVELHPALPALPGLRVRLRLRRAAGAGPVRALPGDGRGFPAAVPGPAGRRGLGLAGGAAQAPGRRPEGPRLLGQGPGHAGGNGPAGRGAFEVGFGFRQFVYSTNEETMPGPPW